MICRYCGTKFGRCVACGKPFPVTNKLKRFCCAECRMEWHHGTKKNYCKMEQQMLFTEGEARP